MEHGTLVDRYCAEPHATELTAAACDAASGARVTADAWGLVAITRPGDEFPTFVFQHQDAVRGAVAVSSGGGLVAVGDDSGLVAVYKTSDGSCVFQDAKADGASRAMRAVCFNRQGTMVAALSIDGVIRMWDIQRWERIGNWPGFDARTLAYDDRTQRMVAIDPLGQPKVLDLTRQQVVDLELVPGGCTEAHLTSDGRHLVCLAPNGLHLLALPSGRLVQSFTARQSSGMLTAVLDPSGTRVGAVTQRSVHVFSLPDLKPLDSHRHGAEDPVAVALWDSRGVAVGGRDGSLSRSGARASLEQVVCVTGNGDHRVAVHGDRIAVWHKTRRRNPFKGLHRAVEVRIDRDGRLLVTVPDDPSQGIQVFEATTGRHLFDAGPETAGTSKVEVGGPIVACMLNRGGVRWYDLKNNRVLDLPWAQHFSLSGSGTWLGVITPEGHVRIFDPSTGADDMPSPEPLDPRVPVRLLSFVNRRPDLLVLDEQGVLGVYDLTRAKSEGVPSRGREVLEFSLPVDRLWGITGGRYAALRHQDAATGTASVLYVDLQSGDVAHEVTGLLPYVWVDPEDGTLVQPARGNAIQEFDRSGRDSRVLRSLPEARWICFDERGVLDRSGDADGE
jgi:WD40 repeat protein